MVEREALPEDRRSYVECSTTIACHLLEVLQQYDEMTTRRYQGILLIQDSQHSVAASRAVGLCEPGSTW